MLKSCFLRWKKVYIIFIFFGLFSLFACEKDQSSTLYQNNINLQPLSSTTTLSNNVSTTLSQDDLNNRKYVELSDVRLPSLAPVRRVNILERSPKTEEPWEYSVLNNADSIGYSTVVKNIYGAKADNKYYLYYSHHDPNSGIGCMIADKITGPYRKLKEINPSLADSQVIACKMHGSSCKPDSSYHFAGPIVVWNAAEKLWFMYFHYEEDEWSLDKGHQKTTLATTSDLNSNVWEIWTDQDGNPHQVLPTTPRDVLWMNSQSSYHAIQQLPNGTWLAFMRGTGGVFYNGAFKQDVTKLGFATSMDGRTWTYFTDNPIITQDQSPRKGVYRPGFVGFLGNDTYLVCWSESNYYDLSPELMCGTTNDFHAVTRWHTGYLWNTQDGTMTPWREGNKFYLINGKTLLEFDLVPRQ